MPVTSQGRETSTVFDDVFRTMLERLGRFMIPVLNEVFGMEYKMDSKLIQLKNEHVTDKMKNVTDSHLQVGSISIDSDQYHLECQSQWDGDISIRMIEYDFSIALENATKKDGIPRIKFPKSCILYLRQTGCTEEKETLQMELSDGTSVMYIVPVVKVQKFTKEEIFEKKLYLLLPFYIMRYEKELQKIELDSMRQRMFIREYVEIMHELQKCDDIDNMEYSYLIDCIHKVADHVLRTSQTLKERIGEIMGGKVLRLRTDVILEQSLLQGRMSAYIEMIKEGLITVAIAASKLGMSEEELKKHID